MLPPDIPQPAALEPTLQKITESLARELACPAQPAPDWSEFEWSVARAVAAMHGVSPLLCSNSRWQGRAGWLQFLQAQRSHTARRHARIEELLRVIDAQAREAGVALVALKGAALHRLGLYQAGDRPMADIDLLVRPAQARDAGRLLVSLGHYESCVSWKERVFAPRDAHPCGELGEHSDNDIKIELHERICEKLPLRIADVSDLVFPPHPRPGLNDYPSRASLMIHLLLHAAGAMADQSLRLLHLHDIAGLASRMTAQDWRAVLESRVRIRRLWWAFPPLQLTARYFPARIPDAVLQGLAGGCPALLRRISRRRNLYDVSLSYLWVDAFPGIEWSRSMREMLAYAASRVLPGAQHRAVREHVASTDAWALRSEWLRLSIGRRVLRWMTSRPARPITVHAVHAAIAQPS